MNFWVSLWIYLAPVILIELATLCYERGEVRVYGGIKLMGMTHDPKSARQTDVLNADTKRDALMKNV